MSGQRVQAPFGRRKVAVSRRAEHGPYVVLTVEDPSGPVPDPGQFYMLSAAERWGGGSDERPFLPRAFSVLRADAATRTLDFLFEAVGPGTARLCEIGAGERLCIVGPLGNGFAAPAGGRAPLLLGGGVGIAPLAILQDRLAAPALLGFRDGAHAAGAELLRDVSLATDDGSAGHHGLVTDLLAAALDEDSERELYACGPPAMLEAVRLMCAECGVPVQLALESGMACGYGACFGCVVPTREGLIRLCVDGPVVSGDALDTALVPGAGH